MNKPTLKIYRTFNWSSYNRALINRGNIAIWFNPKTQWYALTSGKQGRNQTYSDAAIHVVCNNTLAIALKGQNSSAVVVKVPHSTKFDAEKIKQQLGISVRSWNEHMYEMKQLSQRKVKQTEAAAYFDAVFNNSSLSPIEQDEGIIQFYRNVAQWNLSK